jgi:hypothetical protein
MIKMLVTFISLFIIFYVGIDLFRKFTNKEKWEVAKTVSYSFSISILVIVLLTVLVVLF